MSGPVYGKPMVTRAPGAHKLQATPPVLRKESVLTAVAFR